MKNTHFSLSPVTNIILTVVWGVVVAFLIFFNKPHVPVIMAAVGAVLGVAGGIMQHLSIRQAAGGFSEASSLLEVRRAFKATTWGSRYISWVYFTKIALAVLAFAMIRDPLLQVVSAYIAGYLSFMFVREIVTLRDAFYIHRITSVHIPDPTTAPE